MAKKIDREREARILALTDRLVEAAMALNLLEGEARAEQRDKGAALAAELAGLAVDLLEGRTDLLEKLLEQLVAQRLPSHQVLESFGSFSSDLKELLQLGLARYREEAAKPKQGQRPEALSASPKDGLPNARPEPATARADDPILQALAVVFPGREVQKGVPFHGTVLAYYLPQEKLAVAVEGRYGCGKARQEYYCRLEGINLITLDAATAANPWRAAQAIRQGRRKSRWP